MASFADRFTGALALRASAFEDVEHDASSTGQAAVIVLLSSVASGVGWFYFAGGLMGVLRGGVLAVLSWALGAALLWIIGTRVLPAKQTEADWGQLARTVGFAQAPGVFAIAMLIPITGWFVALVVRLWVLTATFIAVRQALDYGDDTFRAVAVCILAWLVQWGVWVLLFFLGVAGRVVI